VPDHYCEDCGNVEYECKCNEGMCVSCGTPLTKDEEEAGRDECFDCYLVRED
jgi:hypothetical protein